ncbi:MAG TPA: hydantoinase B/oxoprolinase family protein [Gemmatimonadales bacterium]
MLDAIGLEVMAHAFAGVAEEMGAVLVASALSPNIRERRDASAALFDAGGVMIAQAAHIPVHLGAMPDAVSAVRALRPEPGETFIVNDPFTGGTHLPDITLVHAVELDGEIGAYTVVRAHHSDVGGARPGSMPPASRSIFEEGLVIPPVRWARDGVVNPDMRRLLLANVRTPDMRRGDLAAQLAACERGAERFRGLVARWGRDYVRAAARDLLDYAERRTATALAARVRDGVYTARDCLEGDGITEDDVVLEVAVTARHGRLRCDFHGTAPSTGGNVNCPLAVTRSAALFVVRCLVGEDVPTNGGVERTLDVVAEPNTVVNASWPRAVVAGNVETSQRITDLLFRALGAATDVPAQGQGTMNNIVLGGTDWTYYETLGGGQGASPDAAGPSGVHVGMSNTRNTPIEVFELEHPMRIRSYALRRGSGGVGRRSGGDGVVREYEALQSVDVSLITERRRHAPAGSAGGADGACGRNLLNGALLGGKAAVQMVPGDVLRIETPGGGGYGNAESG